MTIADRDHADYLAARDSSQQDLLIHAAKSTGRSVLQINREFRQMARSHSRLNLVEFVRNGLHHADRFTAEERSRFISNDLHWAIAHQCNDTRWNAAAEDKMLAATLLHAGGVPVPETVAVLDRSPRAYPGVETVRTVEALRDLLGQHEGGTLFCKLVDGMVSFGAFRIEAADEETITCTGRAPMTHADFLESFVGGNAYLVQRALENHSALAAHASALATVRMVNLVREDDVFCPAAVIKLPQGDNVADAFWRPGNLACDIDPETGRIRTVARRGIETEFLEDHPDTPGLMGRELPYWSELREINHRAARLFAPIRYQSTDIAITPDGPVVVELNYGGGFDLPQYAGGKGLLTPEVRAFFEGCGYDFEARRTRRLPFFGK